MGGPVVKNWPVSSGDTESVSSIPGSERSPGEGNGNPLQYSCLGNPMDRGAWQATVHGVAVRHYLAAKQQTTRCFNVEDPGSIPGLGRSPGEGNGNPFQYSCLENPHGHRTAQGI